MRFGAQCCFPSAARHDPSLGLEYSQECNGAFLLVMEGCLDLGKVLNFMDGYAKLGLDVDQWVAVGQDQSCQEGCLEQDGAFAGGWVQPYPPEL